MPVVLSLMLYAMAVSYRGIQVEFGIVKSAAERKTSLTLNAAALDSAKAPEINVSAVVEEALMQIIAEARQKRWLKENADAFAAQVRWYEDNGHPLAEIIAGPGG